MRHLVVGVIPEELIAPDRHVPGPMSREVRLAVNDAKDLQLRKIAAAPLGNAGEIGYRDGQERCDRARSSRIRAMASGAGHLIYALAVCRLLAGGFPRRTRGQRYSQHQVEASG